MALISQEITVTTAGTAVQGPSSEPGIYVFEPAPGNTGDYVYIGNDGADDIDSDTGYSIGAGQQINLFVPDLSDLYFDADSDGDKIKVLAQVIINDALTVDYRHLIDPYT